MRLTTRSAVAADLPALLALQEAEETRWFGAAETGATELAERLDHATGTLLVLDGGRIRAAAWWAGHDTSLVVDPTVDVASLLDLVLPWLDSQGSLLPVVALATNSVLIEALVARGRRHASSSFELLREVDAGWRIPVPQWPASVRRTALLEPPRVHELIYRRARWSDTPGHPERDLADWQAIFLPPSVPAERHLLAWDGDELVGVALGRVLSDGTGWISQLAVAVDQRGRGLGRALLLEALHGHVAAGASRLGLHVAATNVEAIRLYLDVGLVVEREWQDYVPVDGSPTG